MSSRSRMRMRATIQRDSRVADDYGNTGAPDWQAHIASLPCHAWNRTSTAQSGERYSEEAVTSDYYPVMMVPLGTDIVETDRVLEIKDLRGNQLFGLMEVTAVLRRAAYQEVRMKDHA